LEKKRRDEYPDVFLLLFYSASYPHTVLTPNPFTPSPSPGISQERGKGMGDRGEAGKDQDLSSLWDRL
jgi:hypothetical protein